MPGGEDAEGCDDVKAQRGGTGAQGGKSAELWHLQCCWGLWGRGGLRREETGLGKHIIGDELGRQGAGWWFCDRWRFYLLLGLCLIFVLQGTNTIKSAFAKNYAGNVVEAKLEKTNWLELLCQCQYTFCWFPHCCGGPGLGPVYH